MRGRQGSYIGDFLYVSSLVPGIWTLAETYLLDSVFPNPPITFDTLQWPLFDLTLTNGGTVNTIFTYNNYFDPWQTSPPSSVTSMTWLKSTDGGNNWTFLSSGSENYLTILTPVDGDKYVAVAEFGSPSQTITSRVLEIRKDSVQSQFGGQPFDIYISSIFEDAIFYGSTAYAVGVNYGTFYYDATYSYLWQTSTNGTSWTNITGATDTYYVVDSSLKSNGRYFRLRATRANSSEVIFSNSARLYIS